MVEFDRNRPGSAYARLIEPSLPIWPLIGSIYGIAGSTEAAAITDEVIDEVARAYEVPRSGAEAAVLFYSEHRGQIDGLLEMNEIIPTR